MPHARRPHPIQIPVVGRSARWAARTGTQHNKLKWPLASASHHSRPPASARRCGCVVAAAAAPGPTQRPTPSSEEQLHIPFPSLTDDVVTSILCCKIHLNRGLKWHLNYELLLKGALGHLVDFQHHRSSSKRKNLRFYHSLTTKSSRRRYFLTWIFPVFHSRPSLSRQPKSLLHPRI